MPTAIGRGGRGEMIRRAALLLGLLLWPALCLAQATGTNPPVGSVWTYLGATYGAGWAVTPFGTNPAPPANNNWLAKWTTTGPAALVSAYSASTGGNLIGTFIDTNPPGNWGSPPLYVGNTGYSGAVAFASENNLPASTFALPVGSTGYGKVDAGSTGNQIFGVYGLAELYPPSGTVIAAEFTARNYSSGPVDRSLPPNTSIGTTTAATKGLNLTCGFQPAAQDCSIGFHIGNEVADPTKSIFNTGGYIQFYRQYGLFIEGMPSGNQIGARINTNGNGNALELASYAEPSPSGAIFTIINHLGSSMFYVTYGGDFLAAGKAVIQGLPTSGSGGGLYVCVDSGGVFYKKAACP
jgi:hypothetical protein